MQPARTRGYFGIGAEGVSKSANVGALLRTAHAFDAAFCFLVGTGFDARAGRSADTADTPAHVPLWRFAAPADIKVHLEPTERPGDEVGCYMQDAPVHKLIGYQNMPILSISAEGAYHRVFDVCIPKWLNQAGAKDEFVRLEDVGIHGNMHEMFLDRNSQDVIKFIDGWLNKNVK